MVIELCPGKIWHAHIYIYIYIYIYIIIKVARLSVKSSMKTQSIKLNYKSHKRDFIKTSTVCSAFSAFRPFPKRRNRLLRF